jgi:hypothetical protein
MYNSALYIYINILYIYAPALEAAAPTVFMVWLRASHPLPQKLLATLLQDHVTEVQNIAFCQKDGIQSDKNT